MSMNNKKKIGLCIAFKGTNYGMLLQGFATQRVLDQMGFDTEIIDYHSGTDKGIKWSIGALYVAWKRIYHIIRQRFKKKEWYDSLHKENERLRKNVSEEFRKNYLHSIIYVEGIHYLREISKRYYAVLVGSDQIWLPDIAFSNFFTLKFAEPGVKRISYATSLGVSNYPQYAKKEAGSYWKKMDYISVREQQGKDIIQSICNVPVEVVADPTYLLTKEEWEEFVPNRKVVDDGYLLCYFLGNNVKIKEYARKVADARGLRLVSILSNECNSDDTNFADEVLIGRSVEDFINLIRNADFVLTDSFHGLAFSVINQKQFLVFYRKRDDVKESRNSRIDNIVSLWGIQERLIRDPDVDSIPLNNINYSKVMDCVNQLRDRSLVFLERALS